LEPTASVQNNQLITNVSITNKWVLGDSTRLSQVLINLINNAVKFTSDGQIVLHVHEEVVDELESNYSFKISDTGIGIASEKTQTIFESFSQASSSTTREFGGTGLGLPISKNLVELMGGELQVSSEVNKGSEFYFDLRFLVHNPVSASTEQKSAQEKDLSGVQILLTEDNSINVAVVTTYLDRWSAECTLAENGKEALHLASTRSFDVVLMDIHMPVMDGYEATKRIRELDDKNKANVPIIALTASAMVEIQREVSKAGMDGFVSKPFEPDDLYNTICQVLKIDRSKNRDLAGK
ncbi:MAG: ATP-binding protein, partial [Flavobacteriales bacterium]